MLRAKDNTNVTKLVLDAIFILEMSDGSDLLIFLEASFKLIILFALESITASGIVKISLPTFLLNETFVLLSKKMKKNLHTY